MLVVFEIASLLEVWLWEPTTFSWLVQRLVLGQLGPLAVAPLAATLAAPASWRCCWCRPSLARPSRAGG